MKISSFCFYGSALVILGLVFGADRLWAQDAAVSEAIKPAKSTLMEDLDLEGKEIFEALDVIVDKTGLNLDAEQNITGQITIHLKNVEALDALRIILEANALAFSEKDGAIHVMTAQDFQQKYGHPFNDELQTKIIPLSYIDPPEALAALNELKSSYGKIFVTEKIKALVLMDDPSKIDEMAKLLKEMDVQRFTMVFELGLAKASDLSRKVEGLLTHNVGRLKIDEASNKLIVTDTSSKIEEIRKIVNAIDQRDRQVNIETKMVQISLNDEHLTGVDWEAIVSDYQSMMLFAHKDQHEQQKTDGRLSIGTIANEDIPILMEALDTVGEVGELSSPSVTTNNNKEVRILVGSAKPVVPSNSGEISNKSVAQKQEARSVEMGIKVFVTPAVHADSTVTMTIRPEVSSIYMTHSSSGPKSSPVIETAKGQSAMDLKKGMTIVIGGLIREEKSKVTKKVPFLGDVPFLGGAFRSYTHNVKKTEIVIFMTPKVSEISEPKESLK
jgi:type II secretory pathway component GspD/PulD (secretin)